MLLFCTLCMLQMFVKSLWIVKGIFVWTLHKVPRVVEKVCYAWTIMILIITLLGTSAHPVSHGHPDEGSASPAGGELCGHHASGLGTPLGDWPRTGRCCWWVLWELVLTILQGRAASTISPSRLPLPRVHKTNSNTTLCSKFLVFLKPFSKTEYVSP